VAAGGSADAIEVFWNSAATSTRHGCTASKDAIRRYVSQYSSLSSFPLNGNGRYRVASLQLLFQSGDAGGESHGFQGG